MVYQDYKSILMNNYELARTSTKHQPTTSLPLLKIRDELIPGTFSGYRTVWAQG